jgi:hypothetical protein
VATGESPTRHSCRRRSPREAVTLAGSAFAFARSQSVIISDLSPEGARLDGRDPPPPGDDVFVIVGPYDTMARVMWRAGDKCGIRFDDIVAEDTLAKMKQEAKWMSVAGWYR